MKLGMAVSLGPGHIVLDGDQLPTPKRGTAAPSFRSMSIIAKRSPISATAQLWSLLSMNPCTISLKVSAVKLSLTSTNIAFLSLEQTSSSAIAEGPRDALVS